VLRQHLAASRQETRGREVSRLEGFSDAVFGFALTLLVVALEVPRSFDELRTVMSGFVAFAACFAVLTWIWFEHFLFFRRYGLQDGRTIVLNALLLFVVLFYIYPLKFMFSFLSAQFLGLGAVRTTAGEAVVRSADVSALMAIYGGGFIAVFALFALLHANALRQREALQLDARELYDTRTAILAHVISVSIGVLAVVLAFVLPGWLAGTSGFAYGLLGPAHAFHGSRRHRRRPDGTPRAS
jgi:uncharacterized membrane protein